MQTQSTTEAMDLLDRTKGSVITVARQVAMELIDRHGKTNSRAVRAEMARRDLLPSGKEFWLGRVFNSPAFEWTGEYHSYGDAERNIHERTVKIWRAA